MDLRGVDVVRALGGVGFGGHHHRVSAPRCKARPARRQRGATAAGPAAALLPGLAAAAAAAAAVVAAALAGAAGVAGTVGFGLRGSVGFGLRGSVGSGAVTFSFCAPSGEPRSAEPVPSPAAGRSRSPGQPANNARQQPQRISVRMDGSVYTQSKYTQSNLPVRLRAPDARAKQSGPLSLALERDTARTFARLPWSGSCRSKLETSRVWPATPWRPGCWTAAAR